MGAELERYLRGERSEHGPDHETGRQSRPEPGDEFGDEFSDDSGPDAELGDGDLMDWEPEADDDSERGDEGDLGDLGDLGN